MANPHTKGGNPPLNPNAAEVRAQCNRILSSKEFQKSPRAHDLLLYIVEQALNPGVDGFDQYSIATKALGRSPDFNPSEDPAVRIQAGRVRRKLEHYYLTEGSTDPVAIQLLPGSYCPEFSLRELKVDRRQRKQLQGPTLLLRPIEVVDSNETLESLAIGLLHDLAVELDRYSELRIFLSPVTPSPRNDSGSSSMTGPPVEFELRGSVGQMEEQVRLTFHLLHSSTGEQIWSNDFNLSLSGQSLWTARNQLCSRISNVIGEERGVINQRQWDRLETGEADCGDTYLAILQGYRLEQNLQAGDFESTMKALHAAVEQSPDCAAAWAILSRLWAVLFSHEFTGKPEGIENALACAHRAVEIDPEGTGSRLSLAYAFLLNDALDSCRKEIELTLKKAPRTAFYKDALGYLLILTGDWDGGRELAREAIAENPYPRQSVYCGLWLEAMQRNDFNEARIQADSFTPDGSFWGPLMRLTARLSCGESKDTPAVLSQKDELLRCKPDFETSGSRLIAKYIKFPAIRRDLSQALRQVGIHLSE